MRDAAVKRDFIKAGELIQDIGYNSENADEAVAQAEKIIFDISKNHRHTRKIIEPQELMLETVQEIEKQEGDDHDHIVVDQRFLRCLYFFHFASSCSCVFCPDL